MACVQMALIDDIKAFRREQRTQFFIKLLGQSEVFGQRNVAFGSMLVRMKSHDFLNDLSVRYGWLVFCPGMG